MVTRIPRVLTFCLLVLAPVLPGATRLSGTPQLTSDHPIDPDWNLQRHCNNLRVRRDNTGRVIWFKHEQMKEMATLKVAPEMPAMLEPSAKIEGQVLINVCVDRDGILQNAWVISGHPLLIGSAIDAASHWRFKPYTSKSKPVGFAGTLRFSFSTSSGNGY